METPTKKHVMVVGSGLNGLLTSFWLAKLGNRVTVVDSLVDPSTGRSSYIPRVIDATVSSPMPRPSIGVAVKRKLCPVYLTREFFGTYSDDNDSRIVWTSDFFSWATSFLWNCRPSKFASSTPILNKFTRFSRHLTSELASDLNVETNTGVTSVFYINAVTWEDRMEEVDDICYFAGTEEKNEVKMLDDDDTKRMVAPFTPRSRFRGEIIGGINCSADFLLDIDQLRSSLITKCSDNIDWKLGTTVTSIAVNDQKNSVLSLNTNKGSLTADEYVFCIGSSTPSLLSPIGLKLPIMKMTSYSIAFDLGRADRDRFIREEKNKIKSEKPTQPDKATKKQAEKSEPKEEIKPEKKVKPLAGKRASGRLTDERRQQLSVNPINTDDDNDDNDDEYFMKPLPEYKPGQSFALSIPEEGVIMTCDGQTLHVTGGRDFFDHVSIGSTSSTSSSPSSTSANNTTNKINTNEVVNIDSSDPVVFNILRLAKRVFPNLSRKYLVREPKAYLTAVSVDGLPIIGQAKGYDNLWVNTGLGNFNTSANTVAAAGYLCAHLVSGVEIPVEDKALVDTETIEAFSPSRF